jgi:hypothetical protein
VLPHHTLRSPAVHELLLTLLEMDHAEAVWTVCGVLMNLVADPDGRDAVRAQRGLAVLVEVSGDVSWVPCAPAVTRKCIHTLSLSFSLFLSLSLSLSLHIHISFSLSSDEARQVLGKATPDWQLAGMLCKTLWNLCDDPASMDDDACEQLEALLDELLGTCADVPAILMH